MKLVEGKSALVTGGGRGIGKAVALDFARNGAHVAVSARTKSELDQTVTEIEKHGVRGLAIPADLASPEGVMKCARECLKEFSGCDILVANAGMTQISPVTEYPLEKAQQLFNLNIFGTYAIVQQLLPAMIEKGGGKIIMTSSVQGNMFFSAKKVAYSTSKAAVSAFAKSLHYEVTAKNVQVNAIIMGPVKTKLSDDLVKWGQQMPRRDLPEEVSPIYLFLASDLAKKKYRGRLVNHFLLRDLLTKLRSQIGGVDFKIKEIVDSTRGQLGKEMHAYLRKNPELVDFLLRYKISG